jgi:phospholipase C
MHTFTRREILKIGSAATAAGLAGFGLQGCGLSKIIPSLPSGFAKITDIEHVVILTQENRSFDHYFGSYRGVRGFSDSSAAFQQPDSSNTSIAPVGTLLPFHLDTSQVNAACTHDISHDWVPQHQSWDNGKMDGFVNSRLPISASDAVLSMGYYTRADPLRWRPPRIRSIASRHAMIT